MTISSSQSPPATVSGSTLPRLLIAVLLVVSFMDLLDVTIVAVAAPNIASSLHASPAQLQWMVAAYALSLGMALITGGRIGDQYGRRRSFLIGLIGFVIASAACALAPGAEVLIGMRVVQGLAAGLMVPQVFGIIRASLSGPQMGAAFGASGAVQGLAAIAGPLLGGFLVTADVFGFGWRAIFWVNVPVGLVALIVGRKVLPESRQTSTGRLDLLGALLLGAALLLVLLPIVQGQSWGWPGWGWALLVAGILSIALFFGVQARRAARGRDPIFDPSLLRNRSFSGGLAGSVAFFGGIASFFLSLSIYLQDGTGRSAFTTGLITLPYAVGSMVTSGLGVKLAPWYGRLLLTGGSLLIAASHAVMWLVVARVDAPVWWQFGVPLLIGGLGLGLAAPPLVNVILAGVPAESAGSAGGVLSTVNQIGGSIGIAVLGTLFFTHVASAPNSSGRTAVFSDAFTAILPWQIGLYLLAAALMTLLPAGASAK